MSWLLSWLRCTWDKKPVQMTKCYKVEPGAKMHQPATKYNKCRIKPRPISLSFFTVKMRKCSKVCLNYLVLFQIVWILDWKILTCLSVTSISTSFEDISNIIGSILHPWRYFEHYWFNFALLKGCERPANSLKCWQGDLPSKLGHPCHGFWRSTEYFQMSRSLHLLVLPFLCCWDRFKGHRAMLSLIRIRMDRKYSKYM